MGQPQFEPLIGSIDGANTVYTTPTPYTAGTVAVYVNGQLQMHNLGNPWAETTPAAGVVTLGFAPQGGDTVVAFYIDTTPVLPETEVEILDGTIDEVDDLAGELIVSDELDGTIEFAENIEGELVAVDELDGTIEEVEELEGELIICDS